MVLMIFSNCSITLDASEYFPEVQVGRWIAVFCWVFAMWLVVEKKCLGRR